MQRLLIFGWAQHGLSPHRLAARGMVIALSCFLHKEEGSDRRVFPALGRAARCVNLGAELSGGGQQAEPHMQEETGHTERAGSRSPAKPE